MLEQINSRYGEVRCHIVLGKPHLLDTLKRAKNISMPNLKLKKFIQTNVQYKQKLKTSIFALNTEKN